MINTESTGIWQKDEQDTYPVNWVKVPNKENVWIFFTYRDDTSSSVQITFYNDGITTRISLSREALAVLAIINIQVTRSISSEYFLAG